MCAAIQWSKTLDIDQLMQGSQDMREKFYENEKEISQITEFIDDLETEVRKIKSELPPLVPSDSAVIPPVNPNGKDTPPVNVQGTNQNNRAVVHRKAVK
jgi:hypothetical protein